MITLKSIRIRNFRAIKEITFKPQENGITGIFGPNGAGKSSILAAVLFALYGERPKGVTVAGLRRTGSGQQESSVSVVFEHLGQVIEIIREIKPKGTAVVNIYVDGRDATITSTTAADKWILKRLGMGVEGFTTAFVVKQKELDKFVSLTPAERKKIIEKMAGVETINNALKKAREKENDAKKKLDLLPGSEEAIVEAEQKVNELTTTHTATTKQVEGLKKTITLTTTTYQTITKQLEEYLKYRANFGSSFERAKALKEKIASIHTQLERVEYVTGFGDSHIEELRDKHQTLAQLSEQNKKDIFNEQSEYQKHSQKAQQLANEIKEHETRTATILETLGKIKITPEEAAARVNESRLLVQQTSDSIVQTNTTLTDIETSIEALAHSDECPTCKTVLKNPKTLIQSFKETIKTLEQKLETQKADLIAHKASLTEAEQKEHELRNLETITEQHKEAQKLLKTAEKDKKGSEKKLATLQKEETQLAIDQADTLARGLKAKNVEEDKQTRLNLINELQQTEKELQALEETQQAEPPLTEAEANALEVEKMDIERELDTIKTDLSTMEQKQTHTQVSLTHAQTDLTRAQKEWENKKALKEEHAASILTTELLEKFRKETVSSIAPEMSEYATGLISSMTNGEFTEVRLDDDFNASIVDKNGEERPTAYLSGGEESAVALALRLAVAFLITGGSSDILWLDEPLTAQDKDRRASILSLIRSLPISQIIMINHAHEAQDIVDYEITLTKE